MSIDKDIMSFELSTGHEKALVNIFSTYYYLVDKMSLTYKKYDITRQQYNVLRILMSQQPQAASVNLIKARMLDKMSDVSRIVERLRIKNLVVRQSAAKDKRSVDVIITPKGVDLVHKVQPDIERLNQLISNLTTEETDALNNMLDKIRTTETDLILEGHAHKPVSSPAFPRNR